MAEIRWGEPTLGLVPGTPAFAMPVLGADGKPKQIQFAIASSFDSFFMRFAVEAHKLGFTVQERIVPPNAVLAPFQAVWRWKKPGTDGLYLQLGSNSFTVNGGPPGYSHWDEFVPTVRQGIDGLLASLEAHPTPPKSFGETLLRYIDLFDTQAVKNMPPLEFLADVMGLKLELPGVIENLPSRAGPIQSKLDLNVPLSDGLVILSFAHGVAAGRTGQIFDSTVSRNTEVGLSSEAVVNAFSESHKITNSIFMELTKPLHESMEPVK